MGRLWANSLPMTGHNPSQLNLQQTQAMKLIEASNPELRDVLPRGYQRLEKSTLSELLRLFAPLPRQLTGDAFGLIYEDFLSNSSRTFRSTKIGTKSRIRLPSNF